MKLIYLLALLLSFPAYADTKISALPDGGNAAANDAVPAVRSGSNVKIELNTAASHAATDFLTPTGTVTATGGTVARTLADHFGDTYYAADGGVTCDGTALTDLNITSGTATLSSASYTFAAGDVGKNIVVTDTNETAILNTTIASISSGNAVLTANWSGGSLTNHTGRATFYTTDNTTALQAAINAHRTLDANGNNTKGYKLVLPNGVCATGALTQPRLSIIACSAPNACTLFEKSGTNTDFIRSENFAALTGGGLNYGPTGTYNGRSSDVRVPSWYGLQDIHLDCNKLGQTAGRCVAYYGNMSMLLGTVQMEEAYSDCLYTEASDAPAQSLTDWKTFEEGIFDHVRTRNCGRYGWLDRGPHDKVVTDFVDAESASTGYRSEVSAGLYSGTGHLVKLHAYAETDHTAFYIGSPDSIDEIYPDYGNMEIASAGVSIGKAFYTAGGYGNVDALMVDSGAYRFNLSQASIDAYSSATGVSLLHLKAGSGSATIGNVIMSGISTGTNMTGIKIESSFNSLGNISLQNMTNTGDVCMYLGGSNNLINATGFSCATFIDPTGDGGNSVINFTMYGASNFTSGYPFFTSDYVNLTENNGSVTTYFTQTPSWKSSKGELQSTGTTPAVATGSTDCGTSPTIAGNNMVGKVTVGTSTNGGKCTVTFAGSLAFTNAPICVVQNETTPANAAKAVVTTTTLAITGTLTAGDVLNYHCEGYY